MFIDKQSATEYESELREKYRHCMVHNAPALYGYHHAQSRGCSEELRPMAALVTLVEVNDQLMKGIAAARAAIFTNNHLTPEANL